ncbi:MAG: lytic transglycosylase domain-containing protein [Clostridium sp.]
MNITKVEEFIGSTIAKDVLKKTIGDSPEFDIVYEALMESAKSKEATLDEKNESSESEYYPTGVGQKLDSLPMRVRTEPAAGINNNVEVKAKDLKWDFQIYNESKNKEAKAYDNVDVNKINKINSVEDNSGLDDKSRIFAAVDKYCEEYGVDKNLVLGIIKQESNFDAKATSHAGAKGVMQLMDFNSEAYGITDPYNIEQNIEGGVRHIKGNLKMFDGNVEMALMAYNGGQGTMERRGVKSPSDLYKMPSETQSYVPKVMNYYRNGFNV